MEAYISPGEPSGTMRDTIDTILADETSQGQWRTAEAL